MLQGTNTTQDLLSAAVTIHHRPSGLRTTWGKPHTPLAALADRCFPLPTPPSRHTPNSLAAPMLSIADLAVCVPPSSAAPAVDAHPPPTSGTPRTPLSDCH